MTTDSPWPRAPSNTTSFSWPPWSLPEGFLGLFGPPGSLVGGARQSWRVLRPCGRILGQSWRVLGPSGGRGASELRRPRRRRRRRRPGALLKILGRLGAALGRPSRRLGATLGASWGPLGGSLTGIFGASCGLSERKRGDRQHLLKGLRFPRQQMLQGFFRCRRRHRHAEASADLVARWVFWSNLWRSLRCIR